MSVIENVAALDRESQRLIEEIEALNLSALLLAQNLLKSRRDEAMFRFGIDDKTATLIESFSVRQLQTVAKAPYFLFPLRFDHKVIWDILSSNPLEGRSLAHAMIAAGGRGK